MKVSQILEIRGNIILKGTLERMMQWLLCLPKTSSSFRKLSFDLPTLLGELVGYTGWLGVAEALWNRQRFRSVRN